VAEAVASPLAGKRVVITRALAQSTELAELLTAAGAIPVVFPLVAYAAPHDFAPLDRALGQLTEFDWLILTSENTVRALGDRLREMKLSVSQAGSPRQIACVGPTTARAAEAAGFGVTHSAKTHSGLGLAGELGDSVRNKRVFLPRSDRANPDLPAALTRNGAKVEEVVAYRTIPPADFDENARTQIVSSEFDAILFFSPTAVEHFVEMFGVEKLRAAGCERAIVSIGPITAAALEKSGVRGFSTSDETNSKAALQALEHCFVQRGQHCSMGVNRG
jgi:uroporphyrinogen-III synthase